MNTDQAIKVNLLHTIVEHKRVNNNEALIAAAWNRSDLILKDMHRAALNWFRAKDILQFDRQASMWRIVICGEGNDVICPVCGEALVGTAKEIYYECSLAPDGDNDEIYVETFDAKDRESELIEVVCKGCGLTVPYEIVDFRRVE